MPCRNSSVVEVKQKNSASPGLYQQAVDCVMETYLDKFEIKYPFQSRDGKIVKDVLSIYGISMFCALWQEFLAQDWNWYDKYNLLHKVPHDLMTFRAKLTQLLEDGSYKKKMEMLQSHVDEPAFDFGGLVKEI